MIIFLLIFTWSALFGPREPGINFADVISWVLWWPLLAVSYVFVGRVWCAVCPMGALSDIAHRRFGLNLKAPKIFANKTLVAILLGIAILYQAWIEEVTRASVTPLITGFILWSFTVGAVVSGLLYERWTWCHNICPLGAWSGVFAMSSMVEVRADPEICLNSHCKGVYCYFGRDQQPGCPFKQVAKTMQSNRFCSACGNCLKACPNQAISVRVRAPTREITTQKKIVTGSALISVIAVGVVAFQAYVMTEPWAHIRGVAATVPILSQDAILYGLFLLACVAVVVGLFYLASYAYTKINRISFEREVYRYGLAFLPIALMVHIGHNLGHLFNGFHLVPAATLALVDSGDGASQIETAPNTNLWQSVEMGLVLVGLSITLIAVRSLVRQARVRKPWVAAALPFMLLALLIAATFIGIFELPMVTRVVAEGVS
jgi:polyferredoxin